MSLAILQELERRAAPAEVRPKYLTGLHPKQAALVADPSRFKAALCGRRGGKTWGIACQLLAGAEANPDEMSVYIALTKGHARRNMASVLLRIQKAFGTQGRITEQDGQLQWLHHNGHRIWLAGCQHMADAEKFRGDYYTEVVIDEGASYPLGLLEYLVNDVLAWALVDRQAPLTIVGTPGALPVGFFHDITAGSETVEAWPTHSWTMFDNPAIKDPESELEMRLKRTGEDRESPSVLREFFAKWARDDTAIIYPYDADRNACWDVPRDCDTWVLSMDLGWEDDTTFTITGSKRGTGSVWVLKSYGIPQMLTTARAAEIERLKRYLIDYTGNTSARFNRMVIDEGGLGKSIARDISSTYNLPVEAAEKTAKASAIRNVQAALRTGRLYVHPGNCSQLIGEWSVLPWDDKRRDHHKQFADHCSDGVLYGFRAHPTRETWEQDPPTPGTPEAINAMAAEHKRELSERMQLMKNSRLSPSQKRRRLRR